MTNPISSAFVTYSVPGFGSEFHAGRNCERIESTERGILVHRPITEITREVSGCDLLLLPAAWCKVEREATASTCEICGAVCKNEQGLSAHKRYKHPEKEGAR